MNNNKSKGKDRAIKVSLPGKLNAGVIGVGNMGQHHARNYHEIPKTNLVAIADTDPGIGKQIAKKYDANYYADYREMLSKEKIDLITIAVPTKFHKTVALDCIAKKINILIEKPIAGTVAEAKEIIHKAKQKGVKFTVGHIERFNPAVIKLKEMVDSGKLGKIVSVTALRLGPMPNQIKDANVAIDIGVHDIDIMNWFFGRLPEKCSACGGNVLNRTRQDHVEVFLDYGEASGYLSANWITPIKVRKLTVSGEKGFVELNYITQELDFYQTNMSLEVDDFGEFLVRFGDHHDKKTIPVKNVEPVKAEILSFTEAITKNKRPMVTAREAIEALDIAQKINRLIR